MTAMEMVVEGPCAVRLHRYTVGLATKFTNSVSRQVRYLISWPQSTLDVVSC